MPSISAQVFDLCPRTTSKGVWSSAGEDVSAGKAIAVAIKASMVPRTRSFIVRCRRRGLGFVKLVCEEIGAKSNVGIVCTAF